MECDCARLTVCFEAPFWVAVYEREDLPSSFRRRPATGAWRIFPLPPSRPSACWTWLIPRGGCLLYTSAVHGGSLLAGHEAPRSGQASLPAVPVRSPPRRRWRH